jgi:hypothetical protein
MRARLCPATILWSGPVSRKPRATDAVHVVTNRRQGKGREYVTHLLRRSYREDGRVKNETVGNISYLPGELVEVIRAGLRGEPVGVLSNGFAIERSLPEGHLIAARTMTRRLALARLLDRNPSRERDLCIAMIVARALTPVSSPVMTEALVRSTLGENLGLASTGADDLYGALDWLVDRQARIEDRLAHRHLAGRELGLCSVSSWRSGAGCRGPMELERRRAHPGIKRIRHGLLCDRSGRPIAVVALSGGADDAAVLATRIAELTGRWRLSRVVVCDGAMLTLACQEQLRTDASIGWIATLEAQEMRDLATEGLLRASLFDEQGLREITAAAYANERLVAYRDPVVASEDSLEREHLLAATERGLAEIERGVRHGTLTGAEQIRVAIRATLGCSVEDHFEIDVADTTFTFARRTDEIDAEAALDGIYAVRTNVDEHELPAIDVMGCYTQVAQIERSFNAYGDFELAMHPSPRVPNDRIGAQAFLCMLANYLTWHLRRVWAPLLLTDERPPTPPDAMANAGLSRTGRRITPIKGVATDAWAHSYATLLTELASLTRNTIRLSSNPVTFEQLSQPTPIQAHALELAERAPLSGDPHP